MTEKQLPRILCVDDEPAVLEGVKRNLRREFDVSTATSGPMALEKLAASAPFEVIVSDMRMPGMDGATFLARAREKTPATVRMLLTGQTDLDSAILAVNEGNIFRFLTKPCPAPDLAKALHAGVEQYRLVTAERVLLEKTLRGSIQALVRVLALTSPEAFGRANRVKKTAVELAKKVGLDESWSLEVAAMLSELGCIVLPPDVLAKSQRGGALTAEEQAMMDRVPAITDELLAGIPRLEPVREALRYQDKCWDGTGPPGDAVAGLQIPLGARLLKIARDFDSSESRGATQLEAVATLRSHGSAYDPVLLSALSDLKTTVGGQSALQELALARVLPGMVLVSDVKSKSGLLLVARGQVATVEMLERLGNMARRMGVEEPLLCQVPS